MREVIKIGLDIAKQVFQVHGVDAEGAVVIRRKLRRSEVYIFFERLPSYLIGWTSNHLVSGACPICRELLGDGYCFAKRA